MLNFLRWPSVLAWSAAALACGAINHAAGQTVSIQLWDGSDPGSGATWEFDSSTITPNTYRSNNIHDIRRDWYDYGGSMQLTSPTGAPLADVSLSYYYEILYSAYLPYELWGSRRTHDQRVRISVSSLSDSTLHGSIRISYPSGDAVPTYPDHVVDDRVNSLSAYVEDTNSDNHTVLAGTLTGGRLMHSTFSVPSAGTGSTTWLTQPGDIQGQRSYFRAMLDPHSPWSGYEPAQIFTDIGFTVSPLDRANFYQDRTLPGPGAVATLIAAGLGLGGRRHRRSERR